VTPVTNLYRQCGRLARNAETKETLPVTLAAAQSQFDIDLALELAAPGVFTGTFHDRWYIDRALHGGHVIAAMVRGIEQGVNDPARPMRSLTIHYVAPAKPGPYEVAVSIDRAGRSLSNVSAQIRQNGSIVASALAALGGEWPSIEWDHTTMPSVAAAHECPDLFGGGPGMTNLHANFEYRVAMGGELMSGKQIHTSGGWVKLRDCRPFDAALVAALTDTWIPLPFTMFAKPVMFPTIDLTVQFLRPLPLTNDDGAKPCFIWHRGDTSHQGYMIQDTEVWSPTGVLLARGRQHALLIPLEERAKS
jgi:acyl-CoA thioesterase